MEKVCSDIFTVQADRRVFGGMDEKKYPPPPPVGWAWEVKVRGPAGWLGFFGLGLGLRGLLPQARPGLVMSSEEARVCS